MTLVLVVACGSMRMPRLKGKRENMWQSLLHQVFFTQSKPWPQRTNVSFTSVKRLEAWSLLG